MEPELIISSATQTPATIRKILAEAGYEDVEVNEQTYQGTEPVVEEPPAVDPNAPKPGEVAGTEGAPPVTEPAGEAPPAPKKKPGSQVLKEKNARLAAELATEREEKRLITERLDRLERGERTPAPAGAAAPATERPVEARPAELAPLEAPKRPTKPRKPSIDDPQINGDFDLLAKAEQKYDDEIDEYTVNLSNFAVENRDYEKEKAKREKDERETREKETTRRKAETTAAEKHIEQWKTQQARAVAKWPDWNEKVLKVVATPMEVGPMQDFPNGAELAYWLADHPEEAQKVADLSKHLYDAKGNRKPEVTDREFRIVLGKTYSELERLAAALPADTAPPATDEELDEDIDEEEETPPAHAGEATPGSEATPPAEQLRVNGHAAAPPPKKHDPHQRVGSRSAGANKTLETMSEEELRALPNDQYRKYIDQRK